MDDLFYIIRTLMPYGQPATLSKQEYIEIIAYILMVNGYPAGAQPLVGDQQQPRHPHRHHIFPGFPPFVTFVTMVTVAPYSLQVEWGEPDQFCSRAPA